MIAKCIKYFKIIKIYIYIYIKYFNNGLPLLSSGKSSGYRTKDSGFDSRLYQILCGVVGVERRPLSLVSTTEELLGRNISGSGLENRKYGRGDPLR
jgi:hypothetical protein